MQYVLDEHLSLDIYEDQTNDGFYMLSIDIDMLYENAKR